MCKSMPETRAAQIHKYGKPISSDWRQSSQLIIEKLSIRNKGPHLKCDQWNHFNSMFRGLMVAFEWPFLSNLFNSTIVMEFSDENPKINWNKWSSLIHQTNLIMKNENNSNDNTRRSYLWYKIKLQIIIIQNGWFWINERKNNGCLFFPSESGIIQFHIDHKFLFNLCA